MPGPRAAGGRTGAHAVPQTLEGGAGGELSPTGPHGVALHHAAGLWRWGLPARSADPHTASRLLHGAAPQLLAGAGAQRARHHWCWHPLPEECRLLHARHGAAAPAPALTPAGSARLLALPPLPAWPGNKDLEAAASSCCWKTRPGSVPRRLPAASPAAARGCPPHPEHPLSQSSQAASLPPAPATPPRSPTEGGTSPGMSRSPGTCPLLVPRAAPLPRHRWVPVNGGSAASA